MTERERDRTPGSRNPHPPAGAGRNEDREMTQSARSNGGTPPGETQAVREISRTAPDVNLTRGLRTPPTAPRVGDAAFFADGAAVFRRRLAKRQDRGIHGDPGGIPGPRTSAGRTAPSGTDHGTPPTLRQQLGTHPGPQVRGRSGRPSRPRVRTPPPATRRQAPSPDRGGRNHERRRRYASPATLPAHAGEEPGRSPPAPKGKPHRQT